MLQSIPINSVTVTNRIRKDLGDISALAANISELGLLSPILVNKQYQLLAGERRLTACRELGWTDIPAIIMDTADAERELAVEFAENRYRKDFNREEIVDAGIQMERIESIKAEERRISTQNNNAAKSVKAEVENFPHQEVGKTRDIVARRLGISGKQYERMKFIVEHSADLSKGQYTDWNTGAISTNKAYGLIKKELEPKLPAKKDSASADNTDELQALRVTIETQQSIIDDLQAALAAENPDYFAQKSRADKAEDRVIELQNEVDFLRFKNEKANQRLDENEKSARGDFSFNDPAGSPRPDLEANKYLNSLYSDIENFRDRLVQISHNKVMASILRNETVNANFAQVMDLYYEAYRDMLMIFNRHEKVIDIGSNRSIDSESYIDVVND